jgi:hypothetical protein
MSDEERPVLREIAWLLGIALLTVVTSLVLLLAAGVVTVSALVEAL